MTASGVAVRDRLKHLTAADDEVLRLVGAHLGALASADLKTRCADGLEHCAGTWAARTREAGINRVFVRAARTPGTITLRATASGLTAATASVTSSSFAVSSGLTTQMPATY
ncbi:hypothetical protein [Nonomuraea sp. NPDC049784]|uniref:hypothetical protein n=1 Tax=Nonomuraea sp. NPDC049784 TaxID=3154361 RepID=UPI0033D3C612